MKLINALRIFVAILFLILPIEILGEKIPKYTKMNHAKRKLEENENYIIAKYGTETTYGVGKKKKKFKNDKRQSVHHIKYKGVEIPGDELMSNFIDGLKFKKLHHELKGGKHE